MKKTDMKRIDEDPYTLNKEMWRFLFVIMRYVFYGSIICFLLFMARVGGLI